MKCNLVTSNEGKICLGGRSGLEDQSHGLNLDQNLLQSADNKNIYHLPFLLPLKIS